MRDLIEKIENLVESSPNFSVRNQKKIAFSYSTGSGRGELLYFDAKGVFLGTGNLRDTYEDGVRAENGFGFAMTPDGMPPAQEGLGRLTLKPGK